MILIRGIKGDNFARRIERGVVDCRDVLSINVRSISKDCIYIGNKNNCLQFIKKMLAKPPKDVYIDRTIRIQYDLDSLKDAIFRPG